MRNLYFLVHLLVVNYGGAVAATTLQEAFQSALKKNETAMQSAERVEQVEAQYSKLRGGMLPNLAFNVSHMIQDVPPSALAAEFFPKHQTTLNFSLIQPVFRGLREWYGLSQLNHQRAAQKAQQEDTIALLYRDLATNYLRVLSLEQDLKNLKEQSVLYETRVGELSARTKSGESSQSDLVTAQSTQISLLAEIGLRQSDLEGARETFQFLTGLPATSELQDPNILASTKIAPAEEYLARIEKRPDVQSAQEIFISSDKGVGVAFGGHLPTVDIVGNYYLDRPGILSGVKWDVGLRLTVPIFEGGATHAGYSEAVSQRKEAELELEKRRRAARQEILTLYRRLQARMGQLKHLQKAAELSKKNTVLLQKDFQRRLARSIDVQFALTEYRISQRAFDQAHFDAQLDLLQLLVASNLIPTLEKDSSR